MAEASIQPLGICHALPESLARHLQAHPYQFPLLSDLERNLYRELNLRRVGWLHFLRPDVLWGYLRLMARGSKVQLSNKEEDVRQLGGDFMVDRQGTLIYARHSTTATDRPTLAELLNATLVMP